MVSGDLNASSYPQCIAEVGMLAMGSSTYEWMWRLVGVRETGAGMIELRHGIDNTGIN